MKNKVDNTLQFILKIIKIANGNAQELQDLALEKYDECLTSNNPNFDFDIYEYICCRVINCIDGYFVYGNMDKQQYKEYVKEMNKRIAKSKYYNEIYKYSKQTNK